MRPIPWELAGPSVNIRARWWTEPQQADVVHARGQVIAAIKQALGEAGIDLPFPTNVVLLHHQTEETDGDRTRQREGWPAGDSPPATRHLNEVIVDGGDRGQPEEALDRVATQLINALPSSRVSGRGPSQDRELRK